MTADGGPLPKLKSVDGGRRVGRLPVASALRTLDLESEGIAQLRAALAGPMARAFGAAGARLLIGARKSVENRERRERNCTAASGRRH